MAREHREPDGDGEAEQPGATRPNGIRIQLLGDLRGATGLQVDGDPQSRDFTALYVRDGLVVAGLLAARPRALPALRTQLGRPTTERNPA